MTFGTISPSGFISIAIMTSTQRTVVQLSLYHLSLRQTDYCLLAPPTSTWCSASMVVSLGAEDGNADIESFVVVCTPKSSDFAYPRQVQIRKTIGNHVDALTQEETPITQQVISFISPNLMDRIYPAMVWICQLRAMFLLQ